MCVSRYGKDGLKITAHQSSGMNCPASLTEKPAGVCIQEFTARIQVAEISVPSATIAVAKNAASGRPG